MKKILLLVVFILSFNFSFSQRNNSWKLFENNKAVTSEKIRKTPYSVNQKLLEFNAIQFKQSLATVPQRSSGQAGTVIQFPNSNGELEKFQVWESSNFASSTICIIFRFTSSSTFSYKEVSSTSPSFFSFLLL